MKFMFIEEDESWEEFVEDLEEFDLEDNFEVMGKSKKQKLPAVAS